MLPIPNLNLMLPLNNPGADWGKAATVLGVAAMVIGAVREIWRDHDDLKDMKRKVEKMEANEAQRGSNEEELKQKCERLQRELEDVKKKLSSAQPDAAASTS